MARIAGFRVKNFKVLKDVTLGPLWNQRDRQLLTPMTAVIGKNGVGKSALFDAFGFLADALKFGVEEACDARGRGGFEKLRTYGQTDPIEFEVYYKEHENAQLIGYKIAIEQDEKGCPYVLEEGMVEYRNKFFLGLREGRGFVWKENKTADGIDISELERFLKEGIEPEDAEFIQLEDKRKLGIATLGALKQHPRISAFRRFIEGWYLSYFTPYAARSLPLAGPQNRLNIHGDNLGNVVQFMEREHPERFQAILKNIAGKIPGIDKIDTERTSDGRLLLRFNDKGFQDPFTRSKCPMERSRYLPICCYSKIRARLHFSVLKSLRTGCITSCWRPWPMSFESTPILPAVRRFLLPRTSHTLSMRSSRMRSGFWKRVTMVFRRFAGQVMIQS